MYERFEKALQSKGITAYKVSKQTGIPTSALTAWKQGKSTPKIDKMQLIANYLNVSTDYLYGKIDTFFPTSENIIDGDISIKAFSKFPDNEIAQSVLISNLCDKLKITKKEIDMIIAFRNADEYDQMTVLRTLHLDKQADEEKKLSESEKAI